MNTHGKTTGIFYFPLVMLLVAKNDTLNSKENNSNLLAEISKNTKTTHYYNSYSNTKSRFPLKCLLSISNTTSPKINSCSPTPPSHNPKVPAAHSLIVSNSENGKSFQLPRPKTLLSYPSLQSFSHTPNPNLGHAIFSAWNACLPALSAKLEFLPTHTGTAPQPPCTLCRCPTGSPLCFPNISSIVLLRPTDELEKTQLWHQTHLDLNSRSAACYLVT